MEHGLFNNVIGVANREEEAISSSPNKNLLTILDLFYFARHVQLSCCQGKTKFW